MFLCIGKAHEMYKSYERVGLRDTWQAGVTRPVLGVTVIKYRDGVGGNKV